MGVPVLTFVGRSHAGRVGASLLSAAGLNDFIAADRDAYIAKAAAAVEHLEDLAALRKGMRERLMASPLLDARRLARELEAFYGEARRRYLQGIRKTGTDS